jgi:hypothetical protein
MAAAYNTLIFNDNTADCGVRRGLAQATAGERESAPHIALIGR